jgi:SPP1 family holin
MKGQMIMKNIKIKASTIARICALVVVLVNQCLALFGKGALPFTENMAYQVISLVVTAIVAGINCWYNQDITKIALIAGKLFDALRDGKITEEELEAIVQSAENEEEVADYKANSFLIGFANGILANLKAKTDKKKDE